MTRLVHPFDETDARRAARLASAQQAGAEDKLRSAYANLAACEHAYRVQLAKRITELHADGVAWTVCADLARGDERVARLRLERDVAHGVREAATQAAWRHAADRKDLGRFIDWSARRDLATGLDPEPPSDPVVFGRRAA